MNCLAGIKLANAGAAAKGQILNYSTSKKELILNGERLGPTFLDRKHAVAWARKHGGVVV